MSKKFVKNTRRKALEYEKDWAKRWKENKTFEKSVDQRPAANSYVFYDGPPFITGEPHAGNLISSIVKDAVPRYWTMKGKRVERTWGWDCHGLPAEVFTEKKLGLSGKDDVLNYGLEKYICAARDNMVQTGSLWEDTVDRVGRWVDFKGAYKTMDKEYMESIWWAFKQLHEKGKIYEGEKVLMYCPQDATPLSKNEVTMDKGAYKDVTDPSVFVKFRLRGVASSKNQVSSDAPEKYLLAWTTTPWTLVANTAVAVDKDGDYAEVEVGGERLILAKDRLNKVLVDEKNQPLEYSVVREVKGSELVGLEYEPLFVDRGENAHKTWAAPYVETAEDSEGTGIVHLAPTYGEEDFVLAQEKGFPSVHTLDETGHFTEGPWKGEYMWDINKQIAKDMSRFSTATLMSGDFVEYRKVLAEHVAKSQESGVKSQDNPKLEDLASRLETLDSNQPSVWKVEYIKHSYPHCHRCDTKLMYRAHPSWFMDIANQREDMLAQNSNINWFPGHLKDGRFAKTIETAPDWNISRDRFWATPMPVWEGTDADGNKLTKVVGSYAELKELSGKELDDYHRPWVDDITFEIDGVEYTRIEKVLDCWFESGSMPFAQFHYPFENKQKFEDNFPGDFIVEYVGQVRAWFYYLHAINVGLFGANSFKNVVVTGNVMGNDGYKLSKSRLNFTDPNELMDKFSSDSYRFTMMSSNLLNGEDYTLLDKNVSDVNRKLSMIWNMYDFFTLYAEVDDWQWDGSLADPYEDVDHILDRWVISRLHQVMQEVDQQMQAYDIPSATAPLLDFVDDASNWYVRRSRKRFWKSDNDSDKTNAYRTLHYVLVQTAKMFAPFTPFMAEELYTQLTDEESVHLTDWSDFGHVDEMLINQMASVRDSIKQGLALRAQNQLKVRQPLASATIPEIPAELAEIAREELNVKEITFGNSVSIDTELTEDLKLEGIAREIIRTVQSARKQAGLDVDDRIILSLKTDDKNIGSAIDKFGNDVAQETLADEITQSEQDLYSVEAKVSGSLINISLSRA